MSDKKEKCTFIMKGEEKEGLFLGLHPKVIYDANNQPLQTTVAYVQSSKDGQICEVLPEQVKIKKFSGSF